MTGMGEENDRHRVINHVGRAKMSRRLLALLMLSESTALVDDDLSLLAADINVQTVLTL
jgi:hypothetical protein